MKVVLPLSRYSRRCLTTHDLTTYSDFSFDLSPVQKATMWLINSKCMQWSMKSKSSECSCSEINSCYALIILHSAIYFDSIYHRQLELNNKSCDSRSILFGLNSKKDTIVSSQTFYPDYRSQQQRSAAQHQCKLHNRTSILKPLQPPAANLTGQTADASKWNEIIYLTAN